MRPTLPVSAPDKGRNTPARLQPDSRTTGNTPHAQPLPCIQRGSCQTNRLQASHAPTLKQPSSQHPNARHPVPAHPAIHSHLRPPPAIHSLRQSPKLPAHAFTSRARNTHKHPQAPLPPSERPAILRVPGSLPSARQSSEHPAILRTRPLLSPPNTRPHRRSDTPARHPEIPNTSQHPEIPKFLPVSLHPDSQPRHPKTQKKQSRRNAGSAPNYLQVFTRSYLSRSESGSGSCSSPYC